MITFIILSVLDKILLEDTHEDGGQEASQQKHCHTGVDDTEPVDLQEKQKFTCRALFRACGRMPTRQSVSSSIVTQQVLMLKYVGLPRFNIIGSCSRSVAG